MKKMRILSVMLAALVPGAAFGAELIGSLTVTEQGLTYVNSSGATITSATITPSGTVTYEEESQSFTTTATSSIDIAPGNMNLNNALSENGGGYTISFTADWSKTESSSPTLIGFGENDEWKYQVRVNASTGKWEIGGPYLTNAYVTDVVAEEGEHTYMFVFENYNPSGRGNWDRTLSFYEDGSLLFSYTDEQQYFGQAGNVHIVLGSEATFSNVAVYEGNAAVPEPTTATLSLLALAGLAARRRRK